MLVLHRSLEADIATELLARDGAQRNAANIVKRGC
jgi:hypothetical protein